MVYICVCLRVNAHVANVSTCVQICTSARIQLNVCVLTYWCACIAGYAYVHMHMQEMSVRQQDARLRNRLSASSEDALLDLQASQ